jgi:hypothetical protein
MGKDGSMSSFEEIVEEHYKSLYYFALNMT